MAEKSINGKTVLIVILSNLVVGLIVGVLSSMITAKSYGDDIDLLRTDCNNISIEVKLLNGKVTEIDNKHTAKLDSHEEIYLEKFKNINLQIKHWNDQMEAIIDIMDGN